MAPSKQATDTDHEAADAERRAVALENAYVDGQDVDPADIETAKREGWLRRLAARRAERQADRDTEQHRREQVDALATEVDAMPDDATRVRELVDTAHGAIVELIETVNRRERALTEFDNRALHLGVPSRPEDDPTSPLVRLSNRALQVRDRRITTAKAATLVARMVNDAWRATGANDSQIEINDYPQNLHTIADQIASLDRAAVKNTGPRYRGESGAIMRLEEPLPRELADQVRQGRLVRLNDPEDTE